MWEVQPTLYWRVKRNGKWSFERTRFTVVDRNLLAVEFPIPETDETESESDEIEDESDGDDRSDAV